MNDDDAAVVQIILPEGAHGSGASAGSLDEALRLLTFSVLSKAGEEPDVGMGGSGGYGANFENDVFMLHRYCWCERDGCPWCDGCADEYPHRPHSEDCYQAQIALLRTEDYEHKYDDPIYDGAKYALCLEMGLDYEFGNEVHCSCGAKEASKRTYDACECDWHLGRAQYRFVKAKQAPNFWHKSSGVRIWWYKWIGRDMKIEGGGEADALRYVGDAITSVGVPIDEVREYMRREEADFSASMEAIMRVYSRLRDGRK